MAKRRTSGKTVKATAKKPKSNEPAKRTAKKLQSSGPVRAPDKKIRKPGGGLVKSKDGKKIVEMLSCEVVFGKHGDRDSVTTDAVLSVWIEEPHPFLLPKRSYLQLMPDSARWSISVTGEISSSFKVGDSYPVSIRSKGKGVRHGTVACTSAIAERADFKGNSSYDMPYSELPE
jgi:hypothetical protein